MKPLLLLLLVLSTTASKANNYYFSSISGDDSRTYAQARNSFTPWKTLNKLNSVFGDLQPGDSILFKRDETFYGSITINKSGTLRMPIVISAYGTGNRPIISGLQNITNWDDKGKGIYESSPIVVGSPVTVVTVNGDQHEMGRYPNSDAANGGYLSFESHTNNSSITDNELSTSTIWTGAELVVRTNRYIIDRVKIIGQSGTRISYSPELSYVPKNRFGYFIQNDIRTLDQLGEWYYNPFTKKMDMYFGANSPSDYTIKVSTVNNIINVFNSRNIVLDNLSITGGNRYSVYLYSTVNTNIKNCDVSFSGIDGIYSTNAVNIKIENSSVLNSNNIGINLDHSINGLVTSSHVKNSGIFKGMAQNQANRSLGIRETGRYNVIEYNQVESCGYMGIRFGGDYALIKNNFVSGFNLTKDDGGGIYTADNSVGRKITGNIILNGIGATEGTSSTANRYCSGVYLDEDANKVEVINNTIASCNGSGIFLHNAHEITMLQNTIFDNSSEQLLMSHNLATKSALLRNNILKNNILFAKDADQEVLNIMTVRNDVALSAGNMDSNYYCRPLDDNFIIKTSFINSAGKSTLQDCDLRGWNEFYKKDMATKKTPVQITTHKLNSLIGANKFANGDFNTSIAGVNVGSTGNSFSKTWVSDKIDAGTFQVVTSSTKPGMTTATIPIGAVSTNKKYIIGFTVKNSKDTLVYIYARQTSAPFNVLSNNGVKTILRMTSARKDYEIAFTPTVNEDKAAIFFETPSQTSTWWLDNIKVYEADVTKTNSNDSIRLEYNASQSVKTVALAGTYIDVMGTVYKNKIVLQPFSSAILILKSNGAESTTPNKAPTVSITTPGDNAAFNAFSDITINVKAGDEDGTVSKVEFYNGNTLLHTEVAAPYTWTWQNVPAGNYTITAKATDNGSLVTSSSAVTFSVSEPNAAPTVSIITPGPDAVFNAFSDITIKVKAGDKDGSVSKVEFFNGNTLLHTEVAAPYTWTWQNVPAGNYSITAKATDNGSLVTSSSAVTFSVSEPNAAPAVSIITPGPDAVFNAFADITIKVKASDEDGSISKVDFYNGNNIIHTEFAAPYTWTWQNVPAGNYSITAKATDNGSLVTSSSAVTFSVSEPNTAPAVSITTPGPDAVFNAFADITIKVNASDEDGSISKVDFYNGNNIIHTEFAAPYTWTWQNVPAGNYSITAKATDNGSLVTSSSAVTFSVSEPNTAPAVSIVNPLDKAIYTGPAMIKLRAIATDDDGSIKKVEFFSGTTLLTTEKYFPYTYLWQNVPVGNYTITAVATDNEGSVTTSSIISFSVIENTAPVVKITSPTINAGYTSTSTINMSALASDIDGTISTVEFFSGSTLLRTERFFPYTYSWKDVPAGKYTITAVATDNNGVSSSDNVSIVVTENLPPVVKIISPTVNKNYASSSTIKMSAMASDTDGTISKVEFFNGTTLLTTERFFPYTYSWKDVPAGSYLITVIATDNNGLATSDSVLVSVGNYNRGVATNPAVSAPVISAIETQGTLANEIQLNEKNPLNTLRIKVGPNPASSVLSVFTYGNLLNKELKMTILSISGKALTSALTKNADNTTQLNISTLPSGVYLLQVVSGNDVVYKQFVKQ